jgi:hypothetical protein
MSKLAALYWRAGWLGVLVWAVGGQSVLGDNPKQTPQMTVYVYNWAQTEGDILERTKEVAAEVFREAGIHAELLDVAHSLDEEEPEASEEVRAGSFFVHIVSKEMAKQLRLPKMALGLAPGAPEERERNVVYVSDHMADRMAREHHEQVLARTKGTGSRSASKGHILGHAIAHEIGHVVLRQEAHASEGLMRAAWDRNDFREMAVGTLGFSAEEARKVRARIARRLNSRVTASSEGQLQARTE